MYTIGVSSVNRGRFRELALEPSCSGALMITFADGPSWKGAAMSPLRSLPSLGFALLVVGSTAGAQEKPQFVPTRDVDISYKITRPDQPVIVERRRWLAGEHLERVDGPDNSNTIFDRHKDEIILLNAAKRTFRKLEGTGRQPEPAAGVVLTRGQKSIIA